MNELLVTLAADVSPLERGFDRARDASGRFVSATERLGDQYATVFANKFGKSIAQFAEKAEQVGQSLSIALSAPLGIIAGKALQAAGEMDGFRRGLATLEKDAGSLQKRLDLINDVAKLPGLGFKEAIEGDIKLRTMMNTLYGVDKAASLSQRTMQGFGNALAILGKGRVEFERGLDGVKKFLGQRMPMGEDLEIILDAVPQAGNALLEAFGTNRSDELRKLGKTSQEVFAVMLTYLEKLPRATGGVKNALENFADGVTKQLDKLGMILYNGLDLSSVTDRVVGWLERMVDGFASLSPITQKVALAFGVAAVALPPLLAALGALVTTVIPAVIAGFTAMTGPIGLTVIAIGAAAAAISYHWDRVKSLLVSTGIWDTMKGVMESVVGYVTSIFGVLVNVLQGDWANAGKHMENVFKNLANSVISIFSGLVGFIGKTLAGILSLVAPTNGGLLGNATERLQKWIAGLKFTVPPVTLSVKSVLDGLSFGGSSGTGRVKPSAGGSGDKVAKEAEPGNAYKDAQALVSRLEDQKRDYLAKLPTIPQSLVAQAQAVGLPLNFIAKKLEEVPEKIEGALRAARAEVERIDNMMKGINGNALDFLDKVDPMKNFKGKSNVVAPFDRTKFGADDLGKRMDFSGQNQPQWVKNLEQLNKDAGKAATKINRTLTKALQDVPITINQTLQQGAKAAFEGMGAVIAGLIDGSAGVNALPAMLLGTLGDMMVQLGKMAIGIGTSIEVIKKAFTSLSGIGAIAAGIGLIALGSLAKSGAAAIGKGAKPFASGGVVGGATYALIGEKAGTGANNGELVAPLDTFWPKLDKAVAGAGGGGTTRVEVIGRTRGTDEQLRAARVERDNRLFGRG